MSLLELIISTNGDCLGFLLFLSLIIYFAFIEHKSLIEYSLLFGSVIGMIVDLKTTINIIK